MARADAGRAAVQAAGTRVEEERVEAEARGARVATTRGSAVRGTSEQYCDGRQWARRRPGGCGRGGARGCAQGRLRLRLHLQYG